MKHGGSRTRLYRTWNDVTRRCFHTHNTHYPSYGGRGISVDPSWLDFTVFRAWAMSNGYQDNLTIDRIDNNGDYCPVNCQWIPKSMNSRKKSNMRQVNQYSLNGEFIATYQSIREAERQTSTPHGVGAVCVGKAKRAGNYKWEYKDGI